MKDGKEAKGKESGYWKRETDRTQKNHETSWKREGWLMKPEMTILKDRINKLKLTESKVHPAVNWKVEFAGVVSPSKQYWKELQEARNPLKQSSCKVCKPLCKK